MQVTSDAILQSIQNNILLDTGHMTNSLAGAQMKYDFECNGPAKRMIHLINEEFIVSGNGNASRGAEI